MLLSLSVRNVVLIDSLDIDFGEGFCVFTGETGAGKSILLDSLGLAIGKRAESRLVRSGEEKASVTAQFDVTSEIKNILSEHDIDDGELIIRRVIHSDGKSKCFINDNPASLSLVQEIASKLIEIHGQHDQRGLLDNSTHIKVLDAYGRLEADLEKVGSSYKIMKEAKKKYEETAMLAEKAKREEDYLRHVVKELEALDPKQGEEEELTTQRAMLMNAEKILDSLKDSMNELSGNVDIESSIRSAERVLSRNNEKAGGAFGPAIEALDKAGNEIGEAIAIMDSIGRDLDVDGTKLEQVEERLFALKDLGRKYNKQVDELADYREEVRAQINLIESQDEELGKLKIELENALNQYIKYSSQLSEKRKKLAKEFEDKVMEELKPLKMENSRFKVEISPLEEEKYGASGIDKISFVVSTNPGSPFGNLAKIASGGELSRFMLALKVVLSDVRSVPTIIFDEIDTGIGGAVADAVGKRLKLLSKNFQVMCVTHQPQVASYGAKHFRIEKSGKDGKVATSVEELSETAKKEEIARMLAGASITKEARAAAGKLMGVA